ncbi:MAG: DUF134 domain-containing protein [Actinobacteria bacterium]|nr:DUF134 domain-containing protein [Actinomycetota bacterium]
MDDNELVTQAAAGDESAFELLVRRHTDAAWRMARSMLRDDFAAEEAVQDTFLNKRLNVVALDDVRRERGREDRTDLKVAVEAALAELPDDEREGFVLVEVVGHSREEAAEIVGVPASTMRSRVSRAREKLARALSDARTEATGE